ncbi:MAG: DNA repair protein RecN, partial [Candidatus Atribacteria bacterium]|nr:DNA repair protein RecN [Candidatus Atribacteria bacterium]
ELQVRNFAVIDDVTVKFGNGLNILTGETGAGKTLIIEAINLLIGERADSDLIRENEEKLIVQGYFDFSKNEKVLNFLKDENILYENDSTDDIVISREVNKLGKNRAFINGIFTQVSTLKNLGKNFLDLHGQHDHQSLLDEDTHINIIDRFGKVDVKNIKLQYQKSYKNFINAKKQMDELLKKQVEKEIRLSDLKYRLDEIEKLKFKENEEEELENEKNVLKNYEKIYNLCSHSISLLNGTETANRQTRQAALIDDLALLNKSVSDLFQIDRRFIKFNEDVENLNLVLGELNRYLNSYIGELEFSAERLDEIQERLYKISELKRKYNKSLPEIILYILELREEINNFENLDNEIEIKKKDFEITRDVLKENALELSQVRNKIIKIVEDEIRLELENLNLKTAEIKISNGYIVAENNSMALEIDGQTVRFGQNGIDSIEFLISLNLGESVKPLRKIASGGEISRIMLALKSIISGMDNISTMVFDEIDTGIGGATAIVVGKKLHKISKNCQVICITHLPQIAAFSDHHYFIDKFEENGRTKIKITKLDNSKKVKELSRMLSGMEESSISIMHAEELLEQTKRIKKDLMEEKIKIGN